jgi:tetratricopeptide (TPR) repeat protein/DNA-binding XRE family transcriptional regulator
MGSVVVATESFPEALRRLRERAGLTQEQLAERAGLSAKAISALERGERRHPYPHTVRALATALGLTGPERAALETKVPRRGGQGRDATAPPPLVRSDTVTGAGAGSVPAPLPIPRQLPAVTREFTGRVQDLARLDALLPAPGDPDDDAERRAATGRRPAVTVAAIDGTPGVGKTTLAVAWAHRVRRLFPDGQMYVNLRGYDPGPPASPGEVLDGFLRALNVPAGRIPPTVAERAALFRSLVDRRRMLVVLDNANSAEQVRPLLPGSPSCRVVVTSRARLTGLAVSVGATRINLDLLPPADAVALLRGIIGPRRADGEPEAVEALAEFCARLPLALQLAGQRAAARPQVRLAELAAELSGEAQRLDVLSTGADEFTAVRPVFSWSYRNLPEAQARMFRLLGLHPGPHISTHAAACLAGTSPAAAPRLLDGLAEAHLVEHAGRDRWRLHDLLRAYARERAEVSHSPEERHHVLGQLIGFYLHTAAAADQLLHPGRERVQVNGADAPDHPLAFGGYDHALEWCESERANLVAVTRAAAETGMHAAAWQLPTTLWSFFYVRKHWTDWTTVCRIGLGAARTQGDLNGQARMLNGLATVYRDLHRFDEALDYHRQTLELRREIGDRLGEGISLSNLSDAYLGMRRFDEALDYSRQALTIVRQIGDRYAEGIALGNIGEAYLGLCRYDEALDTFRQVLKLCRAIDHRYGEGLTLIHLGEACLGVHRYDDAIDHLNRARGLCREIGDRHGEGRVLDTLGQVHRAASRCDAARQCWRQALMIFDDLGGPETEEIRSRLRTIDQPTHVDADSRVRIRERPSG